MTSPEALRLAVPKMHWPQVERESAAVRAAFQTKALMVRLGDGEMRYLGAGGWMADALREAVRYATVVGLPDSYDGRTHTWRRSLARMLAPDLSGSLIVSAVLPIWDPVLVGGILHGRRAIWVTHGASTIVSRLRDADFCEFFGFDRGREDSYINAPPGRILPSEGMPGRVLNSVCTKLAEEEFDIAVIGMGLLGKLVARFVFAELGKAAIDAGCILSAMRGGRDRAGFREGRSHSCLVWTRPSTPEVTRGGVAKFGANGNSALREESRVVPPRILVGICSAVRMRERREAVRETWLPSIMKRMRAVFFVGSGAPVKGESDVIQLAVGDDYKHLPEKVLAFFRWALKQTDWEMLFKCDDDTYVAGARLQRLAADGAELVGGVFLHSKGFPSGGAGYLLSRRLVEELVSVSIPAVGREDVLVGRAAVSLAKSWREEPNLRPDTRQSPRQDNDIITAHFCEPELMRHVHAEFMQLPFKKAAALATFQAMHPAWRGTLVLLEDGEFVGGGAHPNGMWRLSQAGTELTLAWHHWPAEELTICANGYGSATHRLTYLTEKDRNGWALFVESRSAEAKLAAGSPTATTVLPPSGDKDELGLRARSGSGQRARVLACCRVSIREVDIFRLWLEHYSRWTDALAAVLLVEPGDNIQEVLEICRRYDVTFEMEETERFHPERSMAALQRVVRSTQADWVLHADSDEFLYELPVIHDIISRMEGDGEDYAMAWMADRLAFGGKMRGLREISSMQDLEAAFPVRAAVTTGLARGNSHKVCLSRWPGTGEIHAPTEGSLRRGRRRLTLEHFKWRDDLESRLAKRIRDHTASNLPWGSESRRILAELRAFGRIRAERHLAPKSRRIHGWMDYEEIYLEAATEAPDGAHFVEVGVWQGRSLCFLAEAALALGKRLRIDGIDLFRNYPGTKHGYPTELRSRVTRHSWIDLTAANLQREGMLDYVNLIQAESKEAVQMYADGSLQFVWIDGDHSYEAALRDCRAWWPKVRARGVLGGHDYNLPEVQRALADASLAEGEIRASGRSFMVRKR